MKVLLRKYNDKYYVWMDAVWSNGKYYVINGDGKFEFGTSHILAIKDDERVGSVMCQSCGAIVKNDHESIEAHYTEQEAKKDCFSCGYVRAVAGTKYNTQSKYEENDDGTYHITQTFDAHLNCGAGYWGVDINSKDVKKVCTFYACRRNGMGKINDPFIKYPGLFEKQITVDLLTGKKYISDGYSCGYFDYDLKCRGTLRACVNELGIVDHFVLSYRSYSYNLYYSEKYDMLFYEKYGQYNDGAPWGIPDAKMKQVKEKIAELYKEAK